MLGESGLEMWITVTETALRNGLRKQSSNQLMLASVGEALSNNRPPRLPAAPTTQQCAVSVCPLAEDTSRRGAGSPRALHTSSCSHSTAAMTGMRSDPIHAEITKSSKTQLNQLSGMVRDSCLPKWRQASCFLLMPLYESDF